MYALNRAQLIGYVTENPQIRQTPAGQMVGDLNIMTKQTFINSSGQPQTSTAFHNVVVWRNLADIVGRFLKRGSQVYIAGRLQTDEWDDATTGQKRYKTRMVADDLIFLDPKMTPPALPAGSKVSGGLNQAEVIGNITRDPELRQTPNGDSVVSFGVATNFVWKDRTGTQQERAEFHNAVAWGALAQDIHQNLKKGRRVYIAGRVQTRSWETPEGVKRYTTEIIADRVLGLGVHDEELGAPSMSAETQVTFSQPVVKGEGLPAGQAGKVIPENPVAVPAINYESEIKPEDLPF